MDVTDVKSQALWQKAFLEKELSAATIRRTHTAEKTDTGSRILQQCDVVTSSAHQRQAAATASARRRAWRH
jgi:hypothetical protein